MAERDGIFAGDDPFEITKRWLSEAQTAEPRDADAVALASVDAEGMPNVRTVLMRGIEPDAFVFFTNYQSAKGQELIHQAKAAFVFHWKSLGRQIRVRGTVEQENGAVADAYYNGRPLGSRIGAWASQQSRPLDNRATLETAVDDAQKQHGTTPERPPHWGGFRIFPLEFEFWADGEFRLHDRFRWSRATVSDRWIVNRLFP